jgi:hypothetical protein
MNPKENMLVYFIQEPMDMFIISFPPEVPGPMTEVHLHIQKLQAAFLLILKHPEIILPYFSKAVMEKYTTIS